MRYDEPELRDILAAQYVLGTLRGPARRRFESLILNRPDWREAMQWWSDRLNLMADTAQATTPPRRVWKNIEMRLFGRKVASVLTWWRSLAIGSSATALVLIALIASDFLLREPVTQIVPTQVAVLSDAQAKSAWMLSVHRSPQGNVLSATPLAGLAQVPEKSFELWLLPADKSKPISLGLLPKLGKQERAIPNQIASLLEAGNLAVSLEPLGGSPTGQPTGEVLYQGRLQQL